MNWYRLGNCKEQNLAERAKTLSFQSVLFEYKERDLKRKGWVGGCILIMIDVLACDMRTQKPNSVVQEYEDFRTIMGFFVWTRKSAA